MSAALAGLAGDDAGRAVTAFTAADKTSPGIPSSGSASVAVATLAGPEGRQARQLLAATSVGTGGIGAPTNTNSTDVPKAITDLNVRVPAITHTFDGDLKIEIVGPDSTTVLLSNGRGANGDNFVNTVFDDEAATPISGGAAPSTARSGRSSR